ncbi:hypothetical protein GCM10011351_08690 [Paraliobacillus quinghaiensis]|uniref:DUF3939 domain-containing protein n=1 Tax=Paraliobacillus quinghaiensis TaxID=470815 RepID=A0A917WSH7_9BACI|nr:DUF3939 domain-containing protein [Paraliobacillus quinghaiensis]GGM25210.1 hypothetical protein GCM10011351_08690 [Paraliobacillus quinghaiensis]
MWNPFKKKKTNESDKKKDYPIIDISITELKHALHEYGMELPKEIPLSIVVKDDLSIDYQLLAPILKGIPRKNYYMSRETYDLFEEEDRQLAVDFDNVQRAVDTYVQQLDDLPVIHGDPYHKVSYHKLEKLNLLDYRPHAEFYITDEENLITNVRPR